MRCSAARALTPVSPRCSSRVRVAISSKTSYPHTHSYGQIVDARIDPGNVDQDPKILWNLKAAQEAGVDKDSIAEAFKADDRGTEAVQRCP